MEKERTKGPWEVGPDGVERVSPGAGVRIYAGPNRTLPIVGVAIGGMGDEECLANAAFIVRAANSHEELVAAAKDMTEVVRRVQDALATYIVPDSGIDDATCINTMLSIVDHRETLAKQRAALAAITKATTYYGG